MINRVKEFGKTFCLLNRSEEKGVVKFSEHLKFVFDQSQSVGPLSQKITVVNTPLIVC